MKKKNKIEFPPLQRKLKGDLIETVYPFEEWFSSDITEVVNDSEVIIEFSIKSIKHKDVKYEIIEDDEYVKIKYSWK